MFRKSEHVLVLILLYVLALSIMAPIQAQEGVLTDATHNVSTVAATLAPSTQTDADGGFEFIDLPEGRYTITAYKAVMGTLHYLGEVTVEVSGDVENINITLSASNEAAYQGFQNAVLTYDETAPGGFFTLRGTVLGPNRPGATPSVIPYSEAVVKITRYSGEETPAEMDGAPVSGDGETAEAVPAPSTQTDADGGFEFTDLSEGRYTITAYKAVMGTLHYLGEVTAEVSGDVENVNITLSASNEAAYQDFRNVVLTYDETAPGRGFTLRGTVLGPNRPGATPPVIPYSEAVVKITCFLAEGSMAGATDDQDGVRPDRTPNFSVEGYLGSVNREPRMAFLLLSDADIFLVRRAAEDIGLNVSVYSHYRVPLDLNLTAYDVIFVDRVVTQPIQNVVLPVLDAAKENNVIVICNHPAELSNIDTAERSYIMQYWKSRNIMNIERLLIYLGVEFCCLDGVIEEPGVIPEDGIYHPDADKIFENLSEYLEWYENDTRTHHVYDPDKPTIGIVFWKERYGTGETGVVDEFIRTTEDRGANVIAAYSPFLLFEENITEIFMKGDEPAVDVMIDLGLGMGPLTTMVKQREYLELLDVPVMKCVELYSAIEEWKNGTTGKGPYFNMQIPVMEIAGEIEFIVVGGRVYNATYDVSLLQPIDSQVEWVVDRALSWSNLRYENNSENKIVIIYYHHSVGNDSCLVAANLDVAPSIVNLLHAMEERGYTLGDNIPTDRELLDLVLKQGRNIGVWVPDQIRYVAENHDVALVPEDEYLAWFDRLPEKKRNEVTERWGPPPGEIMVYENDSGKFIVIPKISMGNILIAPQPSRAAEQNMTALYHDRSVPPTHQYIAFYYWLNHVYGADAIVSVGRHGTQEWLPGKGVGLSIEDCWPAILIQQMPVVYHYEVEGIGEGVIAKRRGNAVMIDHLTPVIVAAGLYGNLSNLEQTIPLYEREENGTLKNKYKEQIIDMCRDLNLDQDLGVDLNEVAAGNETIFEQFLDEMHDYLLEIKREYMPYGLHILGRQLSNDSLVDMTRSLLGYEFREYVAGMSISDNQTRMLLEEVVINGTSPKEAQNKVLGASENVTEPVSENMTSLARTNTDEDGNYTFSNRVAGDYTVIAVKYISTMGGCWFIGSVNTTAADGEDLNEIEVWLTFGEEAAANHILNMTDDPDGLTGTSSISGRILTHDRYGEVMPMANATVIIARQYPSDEAIPEETPLTDFLNLAVVYAENLRECMIEIPRTLDALEGKYIPPGPSNDPIRNPDVLPTGRNFYGFDPNIVPTRPAWEVGKELTDQLLSQYYNGTDESYPQKIGFVMFSFNTMKDLGVLESELFYLLGVEPVWDEKGNVVDVRLIPAEELGRPRIDVVVTMSGIYRENWPHQIELINKAVRLASVSDDSPYHRNFVNESTASTCQWLIERNCSESLAHDLSLIRIFGPPEGVWGVGGFIAAIEGSGTWKNEGTIADLYIRNMANVYGDTIWGEQHVDLFRQNLDRTEVALFGWSSHSHSVLGIDHTFEFFGGLSMAVRSITGEAPDMYISNLRDPDGAKLERLDRVIMRDLRSMYFNPHWIEGMMEHDYAGAREMAGIMENIWGWDVTCPQVVSDEIWIKMYEIYVQDRYDLGLRGWFDENNPWARQSVLARMLEATRKSDPEGKPYWDAPDEIKANLAEEYRRSIDEFGATCCHHTCGNPFLDDYVQGVIAGSEPSGTGGGGSTRHPYPFGSINQTSSAGVGTSAEVPVESLRSEVTGFVMEKVDKESTMFSITGVPLMGIALVLFILCVIGIGFWRKRV